LQSDERLVALVRRGNQAAFEALVARYQARLLAFCRHMLSSKEDAEDVLQEVFAAAFNAMLADDRPINVRPWLYRIARNRSLNHLRRTQAVGVDSMDIHLSEGGVTTADKVHKREEFRLLVSDVQDLPETQRTALLLREIDALSYDQIADAMETTVPSVKSLLVRARVSLAEAAEARLLTCEEVRDELGEVAEGLRRTSAPVRRHLRTCDRCTAFRKQLRETNKALAAIFPVAPLLLLKKTLLAHLGTTAAASGGTAAAAGGGTAAAGAAAGGALQAGASALATKAAAGLAAAAIVTAGAVEAKHAAVDRSKPSQAVAAVVTPVATATAARSAPVAINSTPQPAATKPARREHAARKETKPAKKPVAPTKTDVKDGTLVAAVTPLREQREGDTTTPTDTAGSTQPGGGALPPGQTAPQTQPTPPPAAQPTPSPAPSPSPSPTATASPTPTPVPSVTPSPSPSPSPDPSVTPVPSPTP
jgi:RNA polymerase sigma factor (sigma-70 family)